MSRPPAPNAETPAGSPDARVLPRLLAGVPAGRAMRLDEHLAVHGELPPSAGRSALRRRRRSESPLIERIERAGLRGRGGAAFPTATKLRAVASARGRPIVVINAAEGEPASLKDGTLAQMLPHLMLDGGQLAAEAVGADELIVCVCETASASIESVAEAIEERRRLAGAAARMSVNVVPRGYVVGQESALVNHLNGAPAVPTFTPPMPFQQGVRRRPTLINNAETLAQLALIARHGSQWFRAIGTPGQPGSALVTLSGCVAQTGVYEIEYGASLSSLLDAAGGTTVRPRAALLGGYAGTWIDGRLMGGLELSDGHLAAHGASLGAGVVLLLSEEACPVAEVARVARWLADQSTGQCGPCLNGLDALAGSLEEIAVGAAENDPSRRIQRLSSLVARRGACGHPDGAVRFILSALDVFAAEFADHARHGRCDGCVEPAELPLPVTPRGRSTRREALSLS
jgi:NADH:ubiquinone oxidoreductase subunit F (NADH-binding)